MSTMTIEPVRRSVGVDCGVEEAFRVFTREIGSWWPTESHAIEPGKVTQVVFEERVGGRVYEIAGEGAHEWAVVRAWEPPNRLVLEWKVNPDRPATEIEVTFTPYEDGNGTRVELEHRGWDDRDLRDGYDTGWDLVLGRYVESFSRSA